ncbi:hypothetical protein ASPWEDRAFT_169091 [Aspergillus wentii DTO 134E9]|uniref:Uncharacterized protein n=1 Tax=Aspergillus wentii DTO 134E9 TaxID=1073089 RepID=A0A1L9RWI0_ASPWE|nr:uncharacterized protein ASPWEDRAFT_169091 [Aspergillus wentii DTO 134E9]KAI9929072.1 hypothetical protein MW887_001467 [Aspergillus wentii]OJJ39234.1 hypothetical protein ASPWEDRAFT_169091 [Aspergillus wentii DTO 134E9]
MVFHWFWARTFEVWLTARLLASPTFHRMVGRVHQKVQHIRHGVPPEEMGGTKLDNNGPGLKRFFEYFREEIKDQFKGKPPPKF